MTTTEAIQKSVWIACNVRVNLPHEQNSFDWFQRWKIQFSIVKRYQLLRDDTMKAKEEPASNNSRRALPVALWLWYFCYWLALAADWRLLSSSSKHTLHCWYSAHVRRHLIHSIQRYIVFIQLGRRQRKERVLYTWVHAQSTFSQYGGFVYELLLLFYNANISTPACSYYWSRFGREHLRLELYLQNTSLLHTCHEISSLSAFEVRNAFWTYFCHQLRPHSCE